MQSQIKLAAARASLSISQTKNLTPSETSTILSVRNAGIDQVIPLLGEA